MKANEYALVARCVEDGVTLGWRRAHKHTNTPTEEQVTEAIENAVMGEICEWFTFNNNETESE